MVEGDVPPETTKIHLLCIHVRKRDSLLHKSVRDAPQHPLVLQPWLPKNQLSPQLTELDQKNPYLYPLPGQEQSLPITSQPNPESGSTENST